MSKCCFNGTVLITFTGLRSEKFRRYFAPSERNRTWRVQIFEFQLLHDYMENCIQGLPYVTHGLFSFCDDDCAFCLCFTHLLHNEMKLSCCSHHEGYFTNYLMSYLFLSLFWFLVHFLISFQISDLISCIHQMLRPPAHTYRHNIPLLGAGLFSIVIKCLWVCGDNSLISADTSMMIASYFGSLSEMFTCASVISTCCDFWPV